MYRPPISTLAPYLYEAWYNDIDYAYAYEWFRSHTPVTVGGCSTVRRGNLIGRNLDWTYSESAEFIVHTDGVVGVANAIPDLTDAFVKSGADSELYKIVPFMLSDGMNKHGLVVSTLVVPTDKGDNSVVNPSKPLGLELCTLMLPRFVLDSFVTVLDALAWLTTYTRLYHPKSLQDMEYDQHFIIADKYDTYCLEFIEGRYQVLDISKSPFVTNFHLTGVLVNMDGSVHTPATGGGSINRITPNGSGLERYNLINAHTGDIQALMKDLAYTRAYQSHSDPAVPRWDTEFVGNGRTVDTPTSGYDSAQATAARMYLDRSRVLGDTWQTVHSAIYDIENKMLRVAAQENFDTQWEVSVMADQVHIQHLRGNTAKNDAFTGLDGEITVDTQVKTARVHDGVKQGGYELVNNSSAQTITGAKTFTASPQVPTATTGDNSTKAANTAFVAGAIAEADGNVVHKTGDEEIDGFKTFKKVITVNQPSADTASLILGGSPILNDIMSFHDYNGTQTRCGAFRLMRRETGTERGPLMVAFKSDGSYGGDIAILCNPETDTIYTRTPTPPADDDSTQIPTTAWVRNVFKNYHIRRILTGNKNFYVNDVTGSDTLDEGRGESSGKPFKTIQACVDYVSDYYNVSIYNATINVANGTYAGFSFRPFDTSGGAVVVRGESKNGVIIQNTGGNTVRCRNIAGSCYIQDCTLVNTRTTDSVATYSCVESTASNVFLIDVKCEVINNSQSTCAAIVVSEGGRAHCQSGSLEVNSTRNSTGSNNGITLNYNSFFDFSAPLVFNGPYYAVVLVSALSSMRRQSSKPAVSGNATGYRYLVESNSILDSTGGGAELFPGSQAGITRTGGQYIN